jgi:hypothetical protein
MPPSDNIIPNVSQHSVILVKCGASLQILWSLHMFTGISGVFTTVGLYSKLVSLLTAIASCKQTLWQPLEAVSE